jgi:hypothetical protein
MKKPLVILALIAACGALCAPVWPRSGADEKVPTQSTITESFRPTTAVSETLPRKENKNTVDGQDDAACTVTEPTATVKATAPQAAAPESPQEPPPTPRPTEASAPIKPADTTAQAGAYVPGFGWVESSGENTAICDEGIYENGNKIGSMG